jgi:arylsulfatase A-like enzyme
VSGARVRTTGLAVLGVLVLARPAPAAIRVHLVDLARTLPPQVELGGVSEPVVAFDPAGRATIGGADTTVPLSGSLKVPLALPDGWPPMQLLANALVVIDGQTRWQTPSIARTPSPVATFTFKPTEAGKPVRLVVIGVIAPAPGSRRRSFGPVTVAPGTHLRLTLGVEPTSCRYFPPTLLRVDAIEGRRSRAVLHRRIDVPTCDAWEPVDVALDELAGRTVRFRFRLHGRGTVARMRVLTQEIGDPVLEPPPGAHRPPNVILVSLDTLGAKHLGLYGYEEPTSPNLDALAGEATVFDHAVAHYPSTAASHMSVFTSRLPAFHGVRGLLDVLAPRVDTLPRVLRRAGYTTAAFTEDATLEAAMGFARGFHHYRENRSPTLFGTAGRVRHTLGDAMRWLESRPGQPFFLFVHTYQVHTPYTPPPSHRIAVRPELDPNTPPVPAQLYDGEVHYLDERLGRFLRYLRTRGLLEHTLLVVMADHGESFGEHGHDGHGRCLHEEVMHVPLIVRMPGASGGRRVTERVGLVDVAPTILELAGAPPLPNADGRSLVAALRGGAVAARPLVAELQGPLGPMNGVAKPNQRAVWVGDYKAIRDVDSGAWTFADVAHDPTETPLESLPPPDVLGVMNKTLDWYATITQATGETVVGESVVTPDSIEKLRALGYLE